MPNFCIVFLFVSDKIWQKKEKCMGKIVQKQFAFCTFREYPCALYEILLVNNSFH